jgi:hypothetical protein
MMCVDVTLSNGDRARVPKAWLFAMQLFPYKSDVEVDDESDYARQVEQLRADGIPFRQCRHCEMPFPYAVEQQAIVGFHGVLVEWWDRVRWYFDDADLRTHELDCARELMRVPTHYKDAPAAAKLSACRDPKKKGSLAPGWEGPARPRALH